MLSRMHTVADVHQEFLKQRFLSEYPFRRRVRVFRFRGQGIGILRLVRGKDQNMNTQTQQTPTLRELIDTVSPLPTDTKLPVHAMLRKNDEEPLAEIPGLRVCRSGCAIYENTSGRSVFRIQSLPAFTFHFQPARSEENTPVKDSFTIPQEIMENLPWYIPLTLIGDYRVEFNRKVHRKECSLSTMDTGIQDHSLSIAFRPDADRYENPENKIIQEEYFHEMLNCLTDRQREIFILYFLEGRNQFEIAKKLGMVRSSVSRILHRALERIQSCNFN